MPWIRSTWATMEALNLFSFVMLLPLCYSGEQYNNNNIYLCEKNSCDYKAINAYWCINIKWENPVASLWSELMCVCTYRVLRELDTLPPFFYYKPLVRHTKLNICIWSNFLHKFTRPFILNCISMLKFTFILCIFQICV